MKRWIVPALLVVAVIASALLWRDNRALRRELSARKPAAAAPDPWQQPAPPRDDTPSTATPLASLLGRRGPSGPMPKLDGTKPESRLERRLRRQDQLAAMLSREAGESEEAYKARVLPLIDLALGSRREELEAMRREAEAAAGVTDAQRAQLDQAFAGIYDEVVAFTNTAVADGTLTPYERNVQGVLQYAGGLGSILEGAEGRIGGILSPSQVQQIYGSGFEWGEYLGVQAPWERLNAPPPNPE